MREIFRKTGFFILGIFSLFYVIFSRNFAELRVQVPFFNFPIFVGEILLFICLVLSFFVFDFYSIKGWRWGVIFYFAYVIGRALGGYCLWGPLAFRHAALFYYPIFIFFGFMFYKRAFLTEPLKIFIALLILALCITGYFYLYWILALWSIAFILVRSFRHGATRYFFYTFLLSVIVLSHKTAILTSRTFIVGNVGMVIFLMIFLLLIAKIRIFYKAVIAGVILVLLGVFLIQHSSAKSRSIFDIKNTVNLFRIKDAEIKALKPYYVPQDLREIKLFNPEQPLFVTRTTAEELQVEASKRVAVLVENKADEKIAFNPAVPNKPKTKELKRMVALVENRSKEKIALNSTTVDESITKLQGDSSYSNMLFRLFIWRDMFLELSRYRPILGFSFGKPFRSESLEILIWGYGDWSRDGWIDLHNSYLDILYRMGILGIALIVFLIWQFSRMVKSFILFKSLSGILLCSILINWLAAANFLPILELPYNAIPFWALWGVTLGYLEELKEVL